MAEISKSQVDRLGDRLKKGSISDDDLRLLDAYRESFTEAYEGVVASARSATGIEPVGRWKTNISIIAKLVRQSSMQLSRMQDVAGCRVVVDGIVEQDSVVEQLVRAFPSAKIYDRREKPSHGYRAVHVIATARDKPIEIQVRTELQHRWAQVSERVSDTTGPAIKYGGGDPEHKRSLLDFSENIALVEKRFSPLDVWNAMSTVHEILIHELPARELNTAPISKVLDALKRASGHLLESIILARDNSQNEKEN